jgi:hypothetical protein
MMTFEKNEGTFITGLPDFHLIQLVLVLVLEAMFIGMENEQILFCHTPYLAKLNVAYYTSNARELILSLDIPYYKGTRGDLRLILRRNKIQLIYISAQQN